MGGSPRTNARERSSKVSLSFISNRRIGTRVAAGFALMLAILAATSTVTWLLCGRVDTAVAGYTRLVAASAVFRDMDTVVARYRGHVREYLFSHDPATADAAIADRDALGGLIDAGRARLADPASRALLEDTAKLAQAYAAGFDQVRAKQEQARKLQHDILDVAGDQMNGAFSAVMYGVVKADLAPLVPRVNEVTRQSLLARLAAVRALERRDEATLAAVEEVFGNLSNVAAQLDTSTGDTEVNAAVKAAATLVASYEDGFRGISRLTGEELALVNGPMVEAGKAMEANAARAKDTALAREAELERETLADSARGSLLTTVLAPAGMVLGILLAWLIARSVSRPVVRMCAGMRALAAGDTAVEIPSLGRRDEIGQMASTVAVFRDHMIGAEKLRAQNDREKAEAEADRKAAVQRLVDSFDTEIKGIVAASFTARAAEIGSAVGTMGQQADGASAKMAAVAASIGQASANVATVATAAEELAPRSAKSAGRSTSPRRSPPRRWPEARRDQRHRRAGWPKPPSTSARWSS